METALSFSMDQCMHTYACLSSALFPAFHARKCQLNISEDTAIC